MTFAPKRKRLVATLEQRAIALLGDGATPLDYILAYLSDGGWLKTLATDLAVEMGESVSRSFLSNSVHALSDDAKARILTAREEGASALVEESAEIADNAPETPEGVKKAQLRIGTRQWIAERTAPNLFGKRIEVTTDLGQLHLAALRQRSVSTPLPAPAITAVATLLSGSAE